jgi:hypothetical protein
MAQQLEEGLFFCLRFRALLPDFFSSFPDELGRPVPVCDALVCGVWRTSMAARVADSKIESTPSFFSAEHSI